MRRRAWAVVAGQELRDLWLGGPRAAAAARLQRAGERDHLPGRDQRGNQLPREARDGQPDPSGRGGVRRAGGAARGGGRDQRRARARHAREPAAHARRRAAHLVSGKLLAALSLWFAALIVAVPYVWFLGRDVGAVDDALVAGLLVGTLVAVSLTAFGIIVSVAGELQPPQPLGEPVRPAGAVRADAAARRREAGLGGRAAAAREPDDRRRALHAQRRHQPVRLDARSCPGSPRRSWRAWCSRSSRSSWCRASCRCAGARRDEAGASPCLRGASSCLLAARARERRAARAAVEVSLSRSAGLDAARRELRLRLPRSGTRAPRPLSGLVAHLNVVGLSSGIYVDPEDWSEERTKYLPPLGARRVDDASVERQGGHRRARRDLRRRAAGGPGRASRPSAPRWTSGSPRRRTSTRAACCRSRSACRRSWGARADRPPATPLAGRLRRRSLAVHVLALHVGPLLELERLLVGELERARRQAGELRQLQDLPLLAALAGRGLDVADARARSTSAGGRRRARRGWSRR